MTDSLRKLRDSRVRAFKAGQEVPACDFRASMNAAGDTFEFWLYDMIDDWFGITAGDVVTALMQADGRDVVMHVNSPGGMVTEGIAIYNTMRGYEGKITARVEGMAASAASFIVMAANEIEVEPTGMFMIHDAWDVSVGPADEHRRTADLLDKASDNIARIYQTRAGGEQTEWRGLMKEETWYVGEEAVTAGLADRVTEASTAKDSTDRWSGVFSASAAIRAQQQPAPVRAGRSAASLAAPAPIPDVDPVWSAPESEPTPPTSIADILKNVDLSAQLRGALTPKGAR